MTGPRPAADALVEQGLQLYTSGRLDEALAKWREALAIDPDVPRAADYIMYVSENRTALYRSFSAASAESSAAAKEPADAGAAAAQSFDESPANQPAQDEDALDWAADSGEPAVPAAGSDAPEFTVRVDIDPRVLEGDPEDTERIDLHEYRSTIERSRQRMHTPLTVVRGAGQPSGNDFEPFEPTPVATELPAPSLLVPAAESASSLRDAEAELKVEQATPHGFGGAGSDGFPGRRGATTKERLDPIPDLPPPLPPPDADLSDLELEGGGPPFAPSAPTPDRLSAVPLPRESSPDADADLSVLPPFELEEPSAGAAASQGAWQPAAAALAQEGDDVGSMIVRAWRLYEQGVHDQSLELCESVLGLDPQRGEARSLLERNREALLHQYEERLGDLDAIAAVKLSPNQILWHKLDHKAGFLLSRIDGTLSFNDLLDVSGMDRFETCRILVQLLEQGVIGAAP